MPSWAAASLAPVASEVLAGLNPEQCRAVEAVRGPVCILAGAGSGKTTTITRRVAHQVASGAFAPGEILAVTFTDKAATEMRERLARLGATGVPARTFHAAALAQLRYFRGEKVGEILASKAPVLLPIARALPGAYRFRPLADLATEIEWAKNRRLTPATYRAGLDGHEPPLPDDLMERAFRSYEERKAARGLVDFEDLLELAIRLYDEDAAAAAGFRERYRAFTVDEYQDVNLLQQSLLERWLGDRDDLCVVGDDYQSIYSFTGADARVPARDAAAVPAGARRPARGELPLDAGDPGDREPARAGAGRLGEGAARGAPGRRGARRSWCSPTARARPGSSSRRCGASPARASPTRRWLSSTG